MSFGQGRIKTFKLNFYLLNLLKNMLSVEKLVFLGYVIFVLVCSKFSDYYVRNDS